VCVCACVCVCVCVSDCDKIHPSNQIELNPPIHPSIQWKPPTHACQPPKPAHLDLLKVQRPVAEYLPPQLDRARVLLLAPQRLPAGGGRRDVEVGLRGGLLVWRRQVERKGGLGRLGGAGLKEQFATAVF